MITSAQAYQLCGLLVDYRGAIVELTTAAPEDRMAAAYKFAEIDGTVHGLLHSWVETSASDGGSHVRIELVEASASDGGNDGWIEWDGGECPVRDGDRFDLKFRDGSVTVNAHGSWVWLHHDEGCDIVAYRIIRK